MKQKPKGFVNACPLRVSLNNTSLVQASSSTSLSEFFKTSNCSAYGVVIWKKETIGEILIQDSFSEPSIHFIFNSSTNIYAQEKSGSLGPGSMVEAFWIKKMTAEPNSSSQIIVHIDRLIVYKSCSIVKSEIWIVFSNNTTGMIVGMTENNNEVVYHPNCTQEVKRQTLNAVRCRKSEFALVPMYESHERLRRVIKVFTVFAPFSINISGNVEKCRSFVLAKTGACVEFRGPAVITNLIKGMFIEAKYLDNSQKIMFSTKACHSNLANRISLGSIVVVRSTSAFKKSQYQWYGYEVTVVSKEEKQAIIRKYRTNRKMTNNLLKNPKKYAIYKENKLAFRESAIKEIFEKNNNEKKKKKVKNSNHISLNTTGTQFKIKYQLIDKRPSNTSSMNIQKMISSYFVENDKSENKKIVYRKYDENLKQKIEKILQKFNLNRRLDIIKKNESKSEKIIEEIIEKEEIVQLTTPKRRPEFNLKDILENIGTNGWAECEKFQRLLVLPDTDWQPKERRFIGIHDDFQWVMLGTFCRSIEEIEQMKFEDGADKNQRKPLKKGWWYRRSVPRETPIFLVKEFETRRNIIEDCTISVIDRSNNKKS